MYRNTLALALAALAAASLSGQTARPPAEYVGTVTGDDVYVRSGPGDSYPCTKLSKGAQVKVIGEQFGWLKVLPPRDCFSLISKRYVKAEGKLGRVTGNNVLVRAGSKLFPNRIEVVQGRMDVGDKVGILGESGDFYKIMPPPGTFLWISARYVKPVGGEAPAPASGPVRPPVRPPVPPPPPRRVIEPDPGVVADVASFQAAERALAVEFKRPRGDRDVRGLLRRYEALAAAGGSLKPFLEARIKFLKSELDLANDLKDVEDLMWKVRRKQDELAAASRQAEIPTTQRARTYAAEGLLAASGLFPGGPTGPKRYIVSDPDTRVIYAYVQCTTGLLDLSQHVGAYVGVVGRPTYDERLRTYVVEAEHIIVLRAAGAGGRPEPHPLRPLRPIQPEPKVGEPKLPEPSPVAPKVEPKAGVGRPKPVTINPKPVMPKSVTVTPKAVAPKVVAPKTVTPEPVRPKVVAPRPVPTTQPVVTTAPAAPPAAPLPKTGLPVADPNKTPTPVDPSDYE